MTSARDDARNRAGRAGTGIGLLLVLFAVLLGGAAAIALVMLRLVG